MNLLRGPGPRHQEKWRFPSILEDFNPLLGLITKFNWTRKDWTQRHNSDPDKNQEVPEQKTELVFIKKK